MSNTHAHTHIRTRTRSFALCRFTQPCCIFCSIHLCAAKEMQPCCDLKTTTYYATYLNCRILLLLRAF